MAVCVGGLALVASASALFVPSASGFGTFSQADSYATGGGVYGLAVGDVNGDGKPDIVAGNDDGDDHLSVLLAKGDGTFKAERRVEDPRGPEGVAIARLDGDRHQDLAVADYRDGHETSRVSIFLGRGDGTFKLADKLHAGPGAWLLEAADLNRDGKLDLVTANYDTDGTDVISVLLGKGGAEFKQHVDYTGPEDNPLGLAVGRMDSDQRLDVVTVSEDCSVMIRRANAEGKLKPPQMQDFCAGLPGFGIALGAFDDTAGRDIAIGDQTENQVLTIPGDGSGGFGPAALTSGTLVPNAIDAADLDRDGILDVAVGASTNEMVVEHGTGTGTFSFVPADVYPGAAPAQSLEVAKLNGDKGLDVVMGTNTGVDVFINLKDP